MNEAEFWSIVDCAHSDSEFDIEGRIDALRTQLKRLSPAEIQSFQNHYGAAIKWAYRWGLWGAAFIMNGQISSDGFRYFLDWLVSEGSVTYKKALASPDSLADLPPVTYAESELFGYVALNVFESKTTSSIVLDPTVEAWPPAGEEPNDEDLPLLFPRLAKLYKDWDWLQRIRRFSAVGSGDIPRG